MPSRTIKFGSEEFKITITGNAPGIIIDGLTNEVNEWLSKMGSSVFFIGKTWRKKRRALNLKLTITRKKK